tara:strand:- start:40 stop:228 length:189 start_codon:yes stop_codon:yes gene_type:complete
VNVPAGQAEQLVLPVPDTYLPLGQGVQELFPCVDVNVPAGQAEQLVLPVPDAYLPLGQGVHD